jgi:hypothetical protein
MTPDFIIGVCMFGAFCWAMIGILRSGDKRRR